MQSFESYIANAALLGCVLLLLTAAKLLKALLVAFQSGLHRIPGPILSRFTNLPLKLAVLKGQRTFYIHALHTKYGRFVRIAPNEISIADIDACRIIHKIGSDFGKGPWYHDQSPYQYNDSTCGVFGIRNNKNAKQRRRLFQSAGTRKIVSTWEPQVVSLANMTVANIKRELESLGRSDILKWWTLMTSDVVGSLAFGEPFHSVQGGQKSKMILDIEKLMPFVGLRKELPWLGALIELIPTVFLGRFAPGWDRFAAYGKLAVHNSRAAKRGGNRTLFSLMVNEESDSEQVSDTLIEQEASNLIIAGTDTTSSTLTYLVYSVLKNKHIHMKLVEELRNYPEHPTWTELEEMPYLQNVTQETLRLHPSLLGSLTRTVPPGGEDLGKYIIPAGTIVGTQAWTFQRDPTVFEDALIFNPDRWLTPTPAMKEHMMVWGGPARSCLGKNIARLEIMHAVFRLFRDCPDVALAEETTEESMTPLDFFTVKPKRGVCEIVKAGCEDSVGVVGS